MQAKWDIPEKGIINLEIEFFPPDKRKRDKDNMQSSFKAGQDGLADAWKIDDNRIHCDYKVSEQKLGMVKVKLIGGGTNECK